MSLHLSDAVFAGITAHLIAGYPNEAAGVLLGEVTPADERVVSKIITFPNSFDADEQFHRYQLTAEDMLAAEEAADEADLDLLGIFHSHPDHPSVASEYDREYALPWYSYLIVSVREGKVATAQSWRLRDDRSQFDEEPIAWPDRANA